MFGQKSCRDTSLALFQERDNLNIKARLSHFSLAAKTKDYVGLKSICAELVEDLHNVMDPIAELLSHCPNERDNVRTGTFRVAFVCSVDDDKLDAALSSSRISLNQICREDFQKNCISNNLDFCK